ALAFLATGIVCVQIFGDEVTAPRHVTLQAAGAHTVVIQAGAGYLHVKGLAEASDVQVEGTAVAPNHEILEEIHITAERVGDLITIKAEIPQHSGGWGSSPRLDLSVTIPVGARLQIKDGSGEIKVANVRSAEIHDGSGSIEIQNVRGDLSIHDGSGPLKAVDISGEVRIQDGSGSIDVRRAGSVVVEGDGSGSISITEIRGDVMVKADGSGSISVSDVGGNFTVLKDGSGGIDHRDVRGTVSIPDDR
ncbi:MAG: hypothetical protein V3T77_05975, partial [Planctomycetota bacterium]